MSQQIEKQIARALISKHPLKSLGSLAISLILFAALSYIATLPALQTKHNPEPQVKGTTTEININTGLVTRVIDGDTIEIKYNDQKEKVRLIGIDTPETLDPRKPVQCFGKEASNKLRELVENKSVRLERDNNSSDRDRYDRLLRYVYLEDGTNINKTMIAHGYAREYTYDLTYEQQTDFKQAEQTAKQENRGLWSPATCSGGL